MIIDFGNPFILDQLGIGFGGWDFSDLPASSAAGAQGEGGPIREIVELEGSNTTTSTVGGQAGSP